MQLPVIQHRKGKGYEMVLRASRKLTGTHGKLGLSAAPPLAGEIERPMVQSAHFQTTQNESLESFLDYPVCHTTVYLPVYSLPLLFTHVIRQVVCWVP